MPSLILPLGPLDSWVVGSHTVNFNINRSTLLPGWTIGTSAPVPAGVMGKAFMIDRQGTTQAPVTFDMTWEYVAKVSGTAYGGPQGELAAILQSMTAGQVGTLTVYSVNGDVPLDVTASATARIISIFDASPGGQDSTKTLNIRWFIPGGFFL